MALFEGYERRVNQVEKVLKEYDFESLEAVRKYVEEHGVDVYEIVTETQPIAFENAKWAYILGAAIALKKGLTQASDIAAVLGEGIQAFCIPGSVADQRKVGLGHGNLASTLR